MGERGARGKRRHMRGQFARPGNAALVNTGALNDPLVGGVDLQREIGIGKNLVRQITAAAQNNRTANHHTATPPTDWDAA